MIKKNDFIEIEFTGRIKDTEEIFDTTIKEDAQKAKLELDLEKLKPFIIPVGNSILPLGFDKDLEGKEIQKDYSLDLNPEQAFGKRNPQLTRMIPIKIFHEQKIQPQRGMQLNLGGQIARVLSSSGGRVLVDFNNPLAGKPINYRYKILKKIDDENEKINSLQNLLFRKNFPFIIKDRIIQFELNKEEAQLGKFIELMSDKFEEIIGLKVKVSEKIEKPENQKKE